MSRILAVDPGHTGALAVVDDIFKDIEIYDMPTMKIKAKRKGKIINRTILDIPALLELIKSIKANRCILETQAPRI